MSTPRAEKPDRHLKILGKLEKTAPAFMYRAITMTRRKGSCAVYTAQELDDMIESAGIHILRMTQ
ncbi:hypothetical protein [Faecalibaculum rodentium]|uniref:hypothetical protein n=1 Tax=Faecalibaculum rodentium TaxID=1702221 RepID=UPI003F66803B